MYNEVDRVRLNMLVECSYCQDKNVKCISFSTTLAAGGDYDALDGHHEHDGNRMGAGYICSNGHNSDK